MSTVFLPAFLPAVIKYTGKVGTSYGLFQNYGLPGFPSVRLTGSLFIGDPAKRLARRFSCGRRKCLISLLNSFE